MKGVPRSQAREVTASDRKLDSRIRYGGSRQTAASALPLHAGLTGPRGLASLTAAIVRRPRRLAALIAVLLQTPREHVMLSGSSAGQALGEYFNRRAFGLVPQNRYCRGILLLPQEHADYLRGRRRQALRTNLRRAAAAGIQCEVVTDPKRAADDICHVLRHQWVWLTEAELNAVMEDVRTASARPEMTIAVGRDRHGQPLAMAAAIIDDTVCVINGAVATNHEARWALHDHLVRLLISRRVRYLLADGGGPFGALGFAPNVQSYQHLLGYELRHVIPVGARRITRRRCLVAVVVMVAATAGIIAPRATASNRALAAVTEKRPHRALEVTPLRSPREFGNDFR